MGSWTHIHLEGYCTFSWATKKEFHPVELDGKKFKTIKNDNYVPAKKRPKWCKKQNKKRIPRYRCLKSDCLFFGYCGVSNKDYKIFDKSFSDTIK